MATQNMAIKDKLTANLKASVGSTGMRLDYDTLMNNLVTAIKSTGRHLTEDELKALDDNLRAILSWYIQTKAEPLTLSDAINLLNVVVERTIEPSVSVGETDDLARVATTSLSDADIFVDPKDPYRLSINYRGINLRLNPKRGKYEKWFNLIRFNADQHFPERYSRVYQVLYDELTKKGKTTDHAKLDRKARSAIYQTMTGAQMADYAKRLMDHPSNTKVLPDEDLAPYKFPRKKLWETRKSYFSEGKDDTLPESLEEAREEEMLRGYERLERVPIRSDDDEIGSDLEQMIRKPLLTREKYMLLWARVKESLRRKFFREGGYDPHTLDETQRKSWDKYLEDKTDEYMRNHYLKWALKKPYERWRNAFIGNLQEHYPNRYRTIAQNDDLHLYRDSAKLREETHKAFNQKQLDDWTERVTYETQLLGNDDWLPKGGRELRVNPHFTPENRTKRLEQFQKYAEQRAEVQDVETESLVSEETEFHDEELPEYKRRLAELYGDPPTTVAESPIFEVLPELETSSGRDSDKVQVISASNI